MSSSLSFLDSINKTYIDNVTELPESHPAPNIIIQGSTGRLSGWIDIVGYRNATEENGVLSVYKSVLDSVVVMGDAGLWDPVHNRFMTLSESSGATLIFTNLTKSISVWQNDTNITAQINATLSWKYICTDQSGSYVCGRDSETKTFGVTKPAPQVIEPSLTNPINLTVTEHNLSIEPKIAIEVLDYNYSILRINYHGESITHRQKVYSVENTTTGIYYGTVIPVDSWDIIGNNFSRFGRTIYLKTNLTEFNRSKLNLVLSNFYESNSNVTIQEVRLNYSIQESGILNPILILFLGSLLVMGSGIFYITKRLLWN